MKLVIPKYGFEIEIELLDSNLARYWVDQVFKNNLQNKFLIKNTYGKTNSYKETYDKLIESIRICNRVLSDRSDIFPEKFSEADYNTMSCSWFNETHRIWAEANIRDFHGILKAFCDNRGDLDYHKHWQMINPYVHFLEDGRSGGEKTMVRLDHKYRDDFKSFTDEFDCDENDLQFETTNINLEFSDIGRTQFEQFINNGSIGPETKNWRRITPNLKIELKKADCGCKTVPTDEYIAWCQKNNLKVLGFQAGIAKFVDKKNSVIKLNRILSAENEYIKLEFKK